jgi:hypothetical protein
MNKLMKTKYWATISASSTFVAISYEIKGPLTQAWGVPSYVLAIAAFLFGAGVSKFFIEQIFKIKYVRKIILGPSWIEGYWLIKTTSTLDDQSPLTLPGVLFLEINPGTGALKAVTTRFHPTEGEYVVNSQVAHVQGDTENIQYLNYFKIGYPGSGLRFGMAFGEFSRNDHFSNFPNTLEGKITLEGDGQIRRQLAKRIDNQMVLELKTRYGNDWMKEVALTNGEIAFPNTLNVTKKSA